MPPPMVTTETIDQPIEAHKILMEKADLAGRRTGLLAIMSLMGIGVEAESLGTPKGRQN